jgi:hypothetical protein
MFYSNDLADNCLSYSPGLGPRPYAVLDGGNVRIVKELDPTEFRKFTLPVPLAMDLNRSSYLFNFLNSRVYQAFFAAKLRRLAQADFRRTQACGRYEIFFGLVRGMSEVLEARGAALVVALIPAEEDLVAAHAEVHGPIVRFCQESGFTCLPLLERFQQERATGAKLYFDTDIHWTRDGHRIAADEVATVLRPIILRRYAAPSMPTPPSATVVTR